jgi:hypothetical protein
LNLSLNWNLKRSQPKPTQTQKNLAIHSQIHMDASPYPMNSLREPINQYCSRCGDWLIIGFSDEQLANDPV